MSSCFFALLFLLCSSVENSHCSSNATNGEKPHIEILNNILKNSLEKLVPDQYKFLVKSVMGNFDSTPMVRNIASHVIPTASLNPRISQQCRDDSWLYAEALTNLTEWALKMFDATGKVSDGVLSGNFHILGHFDQCVSTNGPDGLAGPKFTGKYCGMFVQPKIVSEGKFVNSMVELFPVMKVAKTHPELMRKMDFITAARYLPNWGLCSPSSCSAKDVQIALGDIIQSLGPYVTSEMQLVPHASEDYCATADTQRDFDTTTILVIIMFYLLALLLVLGTIYDAFLRRKEKECEEAVTTSQRFLLSFSVWTNSATLLDTGNASEGYLSCLNGIRFFSSAWVVMYHTWAGASWLFQPISNGSMSVDSFFFLSGLLVAYATLRDLEKSQGKVNVPLMYLKRYLRLTPVYAFILLFIAYLMVHLGSGPYWGNIAVMSNACRNFGWKNLLYVNNIVPESDDQFFCMTETWYSTVDMQLFLASPVFIYVLWRWPKIGIVFVGGAILGFTILTMNIVAFNNLPPTYLSTRTDSMSSGPDYMTHYYKVPWCRVQPYLIGILMGYVFHKSGRHQITMQPWLVGTGWTVSAFLGVAVVFGMHEYMDSAKVPVIPQSISMLYASLHRTVWAIALSWLVFACVNGYGGIVNRILSSPVLSPLSRLTYCTYLIHVNWIEFCYAYARTAYYYTTFDLVVQFLNTLVVSTGLAFVATVFVEIPFLNLRDLFLNRRRCPSEKPTQNGQKVC